MLAKYYINPFSLEKLSFKKTILTIAKSIASSCTNYKAVIETPKKGIKNTERAGKLGRQKEKKIQEIVEWIWKNSEVKEIFSLYLYEKKEYNVYKMSYYSSYDMIFLILNNDELQRLIEKNHLPKKLLQKIKIITEKDLKKMAKTNDSRTVNVLFSGWF